ncbi:MAG: Nif3-like dinuclear metal center hexameric protein [Ruminococcaceae bacterium]|nr:Nif3-like dinuclear metal center hexameric protein [Oscillospiraceae bacterium]
MTVEQLAKKLDEIISPELSEAWDNDGRMIIPDPNAEVTRVLCTLDCTTYAIRNAIHLGCNVIITHHPLVFKPLGRVTPDDSVGKRVIECIKNNIAVLSYHTRLDSMEGGVNDVLAETIGLTNVSAFLPYGRIGDYEPCNLKDFAEQVSDSIQIPYEELILVHSYKKVRRVALVSGCGKDEIAAAIKAGADTFLTGEVMHNHLIDCKELGLNLVCATHYGTERVIVPVLKEMIENMGIESFVFTYKPDAEMEII